MFVYDGRHRLLLEELLLGLLHPGGIGICQFLEGFIPVILPHGYYYFQVGVDGLVRAHDDRGHKEVLINI